MKIFLAKLGIILALLALLGAGAFGAYKAGGWRTEIRIWRERHAQARKKATSTSPLGSSNRFHS